MKPSKMKKFNINDYIYIQITGEGWEHLFKTVSTDYIDNCIKNRKIILDGIIWYKLQFHVALELLPINGSGKLRFETTILFDDNDLNKLINK